ncbi:type II toxin-antitoxin system HicB family antitoxin [Aminiphilus circumscriptus]|uniref:type II toxin-antitoxin system HicB family antitoxin n=1 Tax=Aminiphilus circumscriptus TaxID=290732 RepID=UPI0004785DAA|nr:type II toxin-antitoxin system HicB family antitoxin [Aminiphilus circumscriptus]
MKDKYVYPAFFCYDEGGEIGVVFPDLPGCVSQGTPEEEALRMAREALSLHLFGMEEDGDEIPEPTRPTELSPGKDQVIVLVDVFMPPFREKMNNRAVNRMVTLPRWLDAEAKAAKISYSQVLQEGLKTRLGIKA